MNISKIIEQMNSLVSNESLLEIYIGKQLNKNVFQIHNKLFFDFLLDFIRKNGWKMVDQTITKSYYEMNSIFKVHLRNKESDMLNYTIPIQKQEEYYEKTNVKSKKFYGNYYDLYIQSFDKKNKNPELFTYTEEMLSHENVEEYSIFKKNNDPFEVVFFIDKNNLEQQFYHIKIICYTNTISFKKELEELFDIIDNAMCKYKKIDKVKDSEFTTNYLLSVH